ncbi:hypothetical protein EKH55_5864 (plasmid) [Sinorhizobium alkalisoli]|nr:hypothetical protein EKH55_5864 [Sinorhizobium alkalisoli]
MELRSVLGMKLDRTRDAPRLAHGRVARRPLRRNERTTKLRGSVPTDDDMVAEPAGMNGRDGQLPGRLLRTLTKDQERLPL